MRSRYVFALAQFVIGYRTGYPQVSKLAMIAPKDVRPLLSAMSAESLISIQEVPKSADRNPTRMFYLWSAQLSIRRVE
jgi:hypothetical protein